MGGVVAGIVLALGLNAAPIYLSKPVFNPSICAKKRVDPCGCHHVYGIRHCHPNRMTNHCESPVKATVDVTVKTPNTCSM